MSKNAHTINLGKSDFFEAYEVPLELRENYFSALEDIVEYTGFNIAITFTVVPQDVLDA